MSFILSLLLFIGAASGGDVTPRPVEDDERVAIIWQVAESMAAGLPDAMYTFEPSKRGVYVGIVFPQSVTECSVGAWWAKRTGKWSSVEWSCP